MSKSPDAFRTISEVAEWLGVQAHVLRFWESRFTQVKPVKRAGGRRYYRPNDMRLLGGIQKLLHEDGITIKGVQRILREKGVGYVADLAQPLDDGETSVAEASKSAVPAAPQPAPTEQIRMDLNAPVAQTQRSETEQADQPPSTPPKEPVLDDAPLMGGIASLAWNRSDFDGELLSRIAPLAKDLRLWLDRVDQRAAG
ncbi:MAG: MerR family transcriptional regulator [Pseudomonadota bacterium]